MTDQPLTQLSEQERTLAFARFTQLQPHLEDGVSLTRVAKAAELPLNQVRHVTTEMVETAREGLAIGAPS
jgi:hypothetical protein